MKKLASLLLALLLGFCTLSAFAETAVLAPTFALDVQTYRTTFDTLVAASGLTPEWTVSDDGLTYTGKVADYPDVIVVTASDGSIASISLSTKLTVLNAATMGNNFGEMMSYSSMAALLLLDSSFMNEIDAFVNTLISLLADGLGKMGAEPSSTSVVAYGAVFTFLTGASGESSLSADIAFRMTPATAEDIAAVQAAQTAESADLTASASTDAEFFPYTVADYQAYFDLFAASILGTTPVWTTADDGQSISIDVGDFSTVLVTLNAEGAVCSYTCSMAANADNAYDAGNSFGQLIALIGLSSKAAEDASFVSSADSINQFTTEILGLFGTLMSGMNDATSEPLSVTGEVFGDACTFTLLIDAQAEPSSISLGFVYEP